MKGETYIAVGKLGKPHGISGAFRFLLDRELKSKKKLPGHFMIPDKGNYSPWFIKKVDWTSFNQGIILFEEITSPEKARAFNGSTLYLGETDVKILFKSAAGEFDYLVGCKVIIVDQEQEGTVEEITEMPGQTLITIKLNDRDVMIPLVEDFIVDINKRKKQITFNLPEGLIDI